MSDFSPGPSRLLPLQSEDVQASIVRVWPAHHAGVQLLQDGEQGHAFEWPRDAEHLLA